MQIQEDLVNAAVLNQLIDTYHKKCLAQAYLFIGAEHAGKTQTALALAKVLNCEQFIAQMTPTYCDQCSSCIKINSGNHPDIHVTGAGDRETIKIEEIRQLLEQIRLRPFMAEKKVFIIRGSENLTAEAANAFLKTLEEPSLNSLLILTTSQIDQNLDTIRSRCQKIHFHPFPRRELAEQLIQHYHKDPLSAQCLSFFAKGFLGGFQKLEKNNFFDRKNELLDGFILARDIDGFMKEFLEEKESTKEFLDVFVSWIRDSILLKLEADEEMIIHVDRLTDLRKFSQKYTFEQLNNIYEEVIHMYKQLAENLNLKLPLLIIKEKL